jgi:predicted RND superfamily exporter protein
LEKQDNNELFGDLSKSKKGYYKDKLIENEHLAYTQGEKLEGAKRSALEMQDVSHGIMRDLNKQTGQLRDIHGKLGDMNQEIDESGSIMQRIMKRENRNKVIIAIFTIIVIFIFMLIIYFKLAPSTDTASKIDTKYKEVNNTNAMKCSPHSNNN